MTKVSWEGLPRRIGTATSKIVKARTVKLTTNIKAVWPVKSGRSKAGWKMRSYKTGHYTVVNFVKSPKARYNYVADLWVGSPVGSDQLPNGGDPILKAHAILLKRDLGRMKL